MVESVANKLLQRVVERAQKLKVGPGIEEETDIGPAVSAEQRQQVLEYLDIGAAEGAEAVYSGEGAPDSSGYWLTPTVLDRVRPEMRVAREEIFGPVLSLIRVSDTDAAFEAANAVEYGLAASVYTRDLQAVFHFVDRVDAVPPM